MRTGSAALLGVFLWFPGVLPAQGPVITEFMASNSATLQDKDKEFSDWIEIYNPSAAPVSLADWTLTDTDKDPSRWVFPQVTLGAGEFLVVFASGKNRIDPSRELHTNFKLAVDGGYLALLDPSHRVASEFKPTYPHQVPDVSYGPLMQTDVRKLVAAGSTARYFVPTNDDVNATWKDPAFDDSLWASGPTGIGFDHKTTPTYQDLIQTDVFTLMDAISPSIYVRIAFQVSGGDEKKLLQLRLKYDDGFIAFLNGVEVARRNTASTPPHWSTRATRERVDADGGVFEDIRLSGFPGLLTAGPNVLCIQAMNVSNRGTDLVMLPEIEAVAVGGVEATGARYFPQPTPGWPNGEGFPGVTAAPLLSQPNGTFTTTFSLEMTSLDAGAVIHYTLNGAEPSEDSEIYSAPLTVKTTTVVKAKAYLAGLLPSETSTGRYVLLNANVATFSSNLPLVLINTFGKTIGAGTFVPGSLVVIEPEAGGRATITDPATFVGLAAWHTRGSSTGGQPKPNYSMELRDELGNEVKASLLGMPRESDWIFYAPYDFDIALIRNKFMYDLSNQTGAYAPRTRFVEVFTNTSNSPLSQTNYMGVYTFMERIKQDPERVNVEQLIPSYDHEPEIAGGYMWKIDRLGPGESGFSAGGQGWVYVYPKENIISAPQKAWLKAYLDAAGKAISGTQYRDPDKGYAKYVDVDLSIDHHLLNVLSKNVDALRLSTYLFKPRDGKITWGPIWDFDRSINSTDGRDDDPRTWNGTGDGTDYFNYPWWQRMFQDPAFMAKYRRRWNELRKGPFSTANVNSLIDGFAAELTEAVPRNFKRWTLSNPAGWQRDIDNMKSWLSSRSAWIDSQYIEPPIFSQPSGKVADGAAISLTVSSGEIFYTLNGADPKLATNLPAPDAVAYAGPITIHQNTRIRARARIADKLWSSMVEATFAISIPSLVVSEIMFYPAGSQDLEFIEIQNAGPDPVPMAGIHLGEKPPFDFTGSVVATLPPGGFAVVARNPVAFAARYGDGIQVAGKFSGSNTLNNSSQLITLLGPLNEPIFQFTYLATWYPSTSGKGRSLVLRDSSAPPAAWDLPETWRESLDDGGSPGREDKPVPPPEGFQRPGDLSQDQDVTLSDAIGLLRHLFFGAANLPCSTEQANLTLLDANGDHALDASDAIQALRFLFLRDAPHVLGMKCVQVMGCPTTCGAGG